MTYAGPLPLGTVSIEVQWLARDGGDPIERVTAAEIGIRLGPGRNLTRIEDALAQTVRGTARLSAYQLASWFAANWWRLRWEPLSDALSWRMSHHLAAAGGGFVWPDIVFESDGQEVRIVARPTSGAAHESIVYLAGGDGVVSADHFESTIDRFIETTVARLLATNNEAAELVQLWRELREERRDPEMARFRRLEAILGFDPDDAPEPVMQDLLAREQQLGTAAIDEVAAASKGQADLHLRTLIDEDRQHAAPIEVPDATILSVFDALFESTRPWDAGYRLAETVREHYGLGVDPISADKLAKLFAVSRDSLQGRTKQSRFAAAFRDGPGVTGLDVVLAARNPRSRRFELMRLIGGHLATPMNDRLVPATRAITARQKLQRAFAAEFLCPIAGLQEMFGDNPIDEDGIEFAADHYEVPAELVIRMLQNRSPEPTSWGARSGLVR